MQNLMVCMIIYLLTFNLINVIYIIFNQHIERFELQMMSLKRSNPVSINEPIIIDSESEEEKHTFNAKISNNFKSNSKNKTEYEAIPEVPSIQLTVYQMNSDPIQIIQQLQTLYAQYGAVKMTVSQAWNCPFSFGNVDKPITVRKQVLQQLKEGKVIQYFILSHGKGFLIFFVFIQAFQQKIQCMRVSQYKQMALSFTRNYKFQTKPKGENIQGKRQHQYWNLVSNSCNKFDQVIVEYGADLPSSLYGSGFPIRKIHNWIDADFQYETNLFNLNNLHKAPNSILRILSDKGQKISGITLPWMYMGMQFATFCWHVQDLFLNSINYHHFGETKTWYVVPGSQKDVFDEYVKKHYESSKKKNLLQKITLIIDPLELIKAGIKVYKIHQRPRDYVVTFFKAYHCGFSHGYNVGEAVNFSSFNSIPSMKQAMKYYETQQQLFNRKCKCHVLSYEWAIYENLNKNLSIPIKYRQKFIKEYRRVINKQYVFVKTVFDKYGPYHGVKIISSKKKYYHNMCTYCKNYLYLSSMKCATCHKNLCQRHMNKCECIQKKWILVIRQLNDDRSKLRQICHLIQSAQKNSQSSTLKSSKISSYQDH